MEENKFLGQQESEEFIPASLVKRMIAYGMDVILLFILLQLVALLIPNLFGETAQKEFNKLVHEVSLLRNEDRFDSSRMANFLQESNITHETYDMLISILFTCFCLPVLYFFCGDNYFKGQTLGKATFGLRTVLLDNFAQPSAGKVLIRSILKSFASVSLLTPFLLPGFLNFCFCLFNRKKRCVHDYLSKTITVQPNDSNFQNDK